ncbi:LCP family protein [Clostridium cylindrosporum]|uniref:Transcriptional regulator LytR n=1 Tax=Clostridium cylindrosporum DSM 605 TaxID=1121307 RepID=A0A0J8D6S8_CLOCY|nr:LCP family protein [Clostridium cylindrosporum]KMT21557.1 transcriptional regulator LytR [Clostridium cylindrosporum DSM 605]
MSNETRQGRRKVKKKKRSPLKIFLITLLILFIGSGGVFAYYLKSLGDKVTSKSQSEAKKVEKGEPMNFLLLGVDAGDYNGKEEHQRSDTMMLVRYIPKTDKIYMLSIPRDTKVKINGKTQKINAAHAIGGPDLTIKTVEDLLNVDVNYYGRINYEGFKACVDAIGGVKVVVPRDMHYKASDIKINFKKGETVLLNGEKAEQFVRWRKNNNGGGYPTGDVGRAETQQVFMVNFLEKLKSPEGISKLIPLLNTVTNYADTNMDMSTIMEYGKELMNVDPSSVQKEVLAGEAYHDNEVGTWYYLYDKVKAEPYLSNFRDASGASSAGNDSTPLNNENLNISIINSTGVSGLAAQYKERLESLGFNITNISTQSTKKKKTEVRYNGEDYTISGLKNYLNDVNYIKDNGDNIKDIKIILGNDALNGGILVGSSTSSDIFTESKSDESIKKSKSIKILNSTPKSGLAARYKEKLERQGYKVVEIGNYNGELRQTEIRYKDDNNFATEVASGLGTGKIISSNDKSADIIVVLGADVID